MTTPRTPIDRLDVTRAAFLASDEGLHKRLDDWCSKHLALGRGVTRRYLWFQRKFVLEAWLGEPPMLVDPRDWQPLMEGVA